MGDILNFVRYIPMIAKDGGRVVMPCPVELLRLMKSCAGIDQLVLAGGPLPPFDVHIPLLCLPRLLGTTTVERIPATVPYVGVDEVLVQSWRERLQTVAGVRIGIAWCSSPSHRGHSRKSVPLEVFRPLAGLRGRV